MGMQLALAIVRYHLFFGTNLKSVFPIGSNYSPKVGKIMFESYSSRLTSFHSIGQLSLQICFIKADGRTDRHIDRQTNQQADRQAQ